MQSVEWCPASVLAYADFGAFVVQQSAPSHSHCFDIHFVPDLIKTPFPNRSYQIRAFPYRQHVLLFQRRSTDYDELYFTNFGYRRTISQRTCTHTHTQWRIIRAVSEIWCDIINCITSTLELNFGNLEIKTSTHTMHVHALRSDQVVHGFYNHFYNSHFQSIL